MKYSYDDLTLILQRFYRAFNIPVSLLEQDKMLCSFVSIAFEPDPAMLYYNRYAHDGEFSSKKTNYLSINGVHVGMLPVQGTPWRILLGPISTLPASTFLLEQILQDLQLPFSVKNQLNHWFRKTPVMTMSGFLSMLHFLELIINGEDTTPQDAAITYIKEAIAPGSSRPDTYHNSQEFEQKTLYYIEHGMPDALLQELIILGEEKNLLTGFPASSDLQMIQYSFITAITLTSRAAIAGGMDYDYALTLSDQYLQDMQNLKDSRDIPPLLGSMMLDYAAKVQRLRLPEGSSIITQKILARIQANDGHYLSVQELAEQLHMSPSYLSHTFSKDTGSTIRQAIAQSTLAKAKTLLTESDLTIGQIALQLGFSSQPHFQTFFRKMSGISPGEYRG